MPDFDPLAALNIPDAFNTAIDYSKNGTQESKDAQRQLREVGLWPDEDKDE